MTRLRIEVDKHTLRTLVRDYLASMGVDVEAEEVKIETRSEQNWKSEWESADFRAIVEAQR